MRYLKIYVILVGTMIVWGFNVSFIKILVGHFMPATITALRIFTAAATVFLFLGLSRSIRLPHAGEWKYVFGGALSSVVAHHYFLAEGLTETSATNAGLILGLGPLLTALLAAVLLRRRPTFIRFIGFILGGVGVGFTVLAGSEGMGALSAGDADIFLSILAQALSFILIRKAAETLDPRLLTGYMLFFGSLILFLISLWKEPDGLASLAGAPMLTWFIFICSAVFATAVGHMIYNYAIGQIGAAETSIFMNLSTFFSLMGAAVILGETILPSHFIGLLFIISGVLLGSGSLEELILQKRHSRLRAEKRS
ncbi:DMT family transporter [Bacillus xiapuensis]|uniref:DMT family transporter n=1 Tax=Bacillus xiapuensis TaxID=2014075 RepID=UPI000C250C1B|nr:DMT family transporter [Bacillus xiapuensis]